MGAHGHGPKKEDRKAFGWVFDISNCLLLMVVGFGHSNLGMSVWVSGCLGFRVWELDPGFEFETHLLQLLVSCFKLRNSKS